MVAQKQFKVGDRVVINEKNPAHQGKKGTIKYLSGGMCWIKFDDTNDLASGFYTWWLEPAN